MKKLYGGARISKVFREKFAFECAKVLHRVKFM